MRIDDNEYYNDDDNDNDGNNDQVGEGQELSSDALHDMAAVLDRSAGAGDKSLLEVITVKTAHLVKCKLHAKSNRNWRVKKRFRSAGKPPGGYFFSEHPLYYFLCP